jgi:hypothetical protein
MELNSIETQLLVYTINGGSKKCRLAEDWGLCIGFAHCWRPYSDFEMQNSNEGTVSLFKFVEIYGIKQYWNTQGVSMFYILGISIFDKLFNLVSFSRNK